MENFKGLIFGTIAVILWSLSPTFAGILQYKANYFAIVLLMFTFSLITIGILIFSPISKIIGISKNEFYSEVRRLNKKSIIFIICSGTFITTYYLCYYFSLHNGPRIEVNMVNFLWPIITIIFSIYVFKNKNEKLNIARWSLVIVSFTGASFIAYDNGIFTNFNFNYVYLIAFGASISAGLYLNFNMKLNKHLSSSLYIFFLILIAALFVLLIFFLIVHPELLITKKAFFGIFFISVFVFVGGQITWAEALKHSKTISVSTLSYFTPIMSIAFLNIFLGDKLSSKLLFGATMIIVSNFLLNINFKNLNATSVAFTFFTIGGLYMYMTYKDIPSIELGEIGYLMELFGILIAFIYSRIHTMNTQANENLLKINNNLIQIYDKITDSEKNKISEIIDSLFISIIELDYNQTINHYKKLTFDVINKYNELKNKISNSENKDNLKPYIENLKIDINMFTIYSNYKLPTSEKIVVWLLGTMSVISFFVTRATSFLSDIFALGFSMAIIFLLVQINDINNNNLEYNISDLMLYQNILTHINKDFYIPRQLIENNKIPWLVGTNETIKIRYHSENYLTTKSFKPNSKFQNHLAYFLLFLTIVIISLLIYSNYASVDVEKLINML